MAESSPPSSISPPSTGVVPVQTAPTEIVSELPEPLKSAGGISQMPASSVIDSLRRENIGIRGDASMLMLQSLVQGVEHRQILEHGEKQKLQVELDILRQSHADLKTQNEVLKVELKQTYSDQNTRTVCTTIGAAGLGIFAPLLIQAPNAVTIIATVGFTVILLYGMFFLGFKRNPAQTK